MGIDLGTASVKALIVDSQGGICAQAGRGYSFKSPRYGWAEQNCDEWYEAVCEVSRKALSAFKGSAQQIKAVALSGQMHGLVPLDGNFTPVRNAILHCDARSAAEVRFLAGFCAEKRLSIADFNSVYTGFLLPSLLWLRENEPQNYAKIRHVCLPKDYVNCKLTGELGSDISDASGTLAFDIENFCWSKQALSALEIPEEWFPPCKSAAEALGLISAKAAEATGLCAGTPVAHGGADQVMQALGNGAVSPGDATLNIGSSAQICFQSGAPVKGAAAALNTFCGFERGAWITMGAMMSAGISMRWFAENIAPPGVNFAALDAQAAQLPAGSEGLFFHPYLNGERSPHMNSALRGAWTGLSFSTGMPHLARAIMEGVAYSLAWCMESCAEFGLGASEFIVSGGGAQSVLWRQILADVFGSPLKIAEVSEQAAFGAAITAAAQAGFFGSAGEASRAMARYKPERVEPDKKRAAFYKEQFLKFKALGKMLNGFYEDKF
ncbi:MAG: xylulokinase [Spirochaetaceae bacterium]|jgi:xylulokinase|nr:xylulokinase [Spirochaetaceae bacterium]